MIIYASEYGKDIRINVI